jgi:hypothetical protein
VSLPNDCIACSGSLGVTKVYCMPEIIDVAGRMGDSRGDQSLFFIAKSPSQGSNHTKH